jgi:hypothetical protein
MNSGMLLLFGAQRNLEISRDKIGSNHFRAEIEI